VYVMKHKLTTYFLFSAGLLLLCTMLFAHHGTGVSYDNAKAFVAKATVTEFRYANPHPQLYFDVKDEEGNVEHWSGELAPNPAQLIQAGWGKKRSEAALTPGTEVMVTIAPARAGGPVGLIQKIVNSKGEQVLGAIALGPPAGAEGKQ
jgi:uncharacterized protein DUF6152